MACAHTADARQTMQVHDYRSVCWHGWHTEASVAQTKHINIRDLDFFCPSKPLNQNEYHSQELICLSNLHAQKQVSKTVLIASFQLPLNLHSIWWTLFPKVAIFVKTSKLLTCLLLERRYVKNKLCQLTMESFILLRCDLTNLFTYS